ncbi:MAG: DHA2 family efflux MFS transporter permease subunit [Thermaerobacter sp.]|nr:DHA2 family efflux MFS transporter permease subunit [Thermaerobacter sp.]
MSLAKPVGLPVLALLALAIGVSMTWLDTNIVNIAIPTIMGAFGVGINRVEWIFTVYILTMAVAMPLSRWLGEELGYRRLFMIAVGLFTVGSLMAGASWNIYSMIVFRAIQGFGGGIIMPVAMTLLFRVVPRQKIGTAMGIWSVVLMVAPTIAPVLGGYLVEYWSWRFIFYINLPVCILTLILVEMLVPKDAKTSAGIFDFPGFITAAGGLFALLFAISEGQTYGWTSEPIILSFYLAMALLILFVAIEMKHKNPLLDLRVFGSAQFTIANLLGVVQVLGFYSSVFYVPIFLQDIQHMTSMQAGMILFVPAVVSGVISPISGRIYDRFGPQIVIIPGLVVIGIFTYMLHFIQIAISDAAIEIWLAGCYLGLGLVMTPMISSAMAHIPPQHSGTANTLFSIVRSASASFGLAMLNVMLLNDEANYMSSMRGYYTPGSHATVAAQMAAHTAQLPQAMLSNIYQIIQTNALVQSIDNIFLFVSAMAFAAIFLAVFLRRKVHS